MKEKSVGQCHSVYFYYLPCVGIFVNNVDTKKRFLDLFASENFLYLCDGSGRVHQLRSTRENCQTLFRGV